MDAQQERQDIERMLNEFLAPHLEIRKQIQERARYESQRLMERVRDNNDT